MESVSEGVIMTGESSEEQAGSGWFLERVPERPGLCMRQWVWRELLGTSRVPSLRDFSDVIDGSLVTFKLALS